MFVFFFEQNNRAKVIKKWIRFVKLVDFDNFWMLKGMLTTYFVCKKDNFCP